MARATRVGGRQSWTYHGAWNERKVAPQTWKGSFKATKYQRRRGRFPRGGRLVWGIHGRQYVVKTGNNRYQTNYVFHKRLLHKRIPKRKRR